MSESKEDLVHSLGKATKGDGFTIPSFIIILILTIGLGGALGLFGSTFTPTKAQKKTTTTETKGGIPKAQGVLDKKKFPDTVEGMLKEAGKDGEGSFHLERPGGETQNVYLTSSTVDLSLYIGKKIRVRGETQKAQKVGWLMDVGYVEIL